MRAVVIAVLLGAGPSCGRINFDADATIVAHFTCDESDGVLTERGGLGHVGTCTHGITCPARVPGRVASACDFDGIDDFVRVAHHDSFVPARGFTVALWVMPRSYRTITMMAKPVGAGADNSWQLSMSAACAPGTVSFSGGSEDDAAARSLCSSAAIPLHAWTHVAGTWDGTTKRLYVDGVEVNRRDLPLRFDDHDIFIGADLNDEMLEDPLFVGALDELHIHDTALSAQAIAALAMP